MGYGGTVLIPRSPHGDVVVVVVVVVVVYFVIDSVWKRLDTTSYVLY
jgi:hypothetical protein